MPNDRTKRLFIGINLPTRTVKAITTKLDEFIGNWPSLKRVDPLGMHITLHFLGDVDFAVIKNIEQAMQSIESKFNDEWQFTPTQLSGFPTKSNPRVIYIACEQIGSKAVFTLHKLLGEYLSKLGFSLDKRLWQPHITIGRLRENAQPFILPEIEFKSVGPFTVDSFCLIESVLRPTGAEYNILAEFYLKKTTGEKPSY